MFQQLEVKKTYDIKNCKLKRAYSKNGLEIMVDEETDI